MRTYDWVHKKTKEDLKLEGTEPKKLEGGKRRWTEKRYSGNKYEIFKI